jgi:hypothetical protein
MPHKSRAKTPRRKEECEGDDGDEEGISGMQTKETAGDEPFSLREKVPEGRMRVRSNDRRRGYLLTRCDRF